MTRLVISARNITGITDAATTFGGVISCMSRTSSDVAVGLNVAGIDCL